jgi:carboxymethylenebutenolidase
MGEIVSLTAEDGHTLAGYRAAPPGTARGGLVTVYGGAIGERAQKKPRCPVPLHWGETNQSIPPDHWKTVSTAHPDMHVCPAGHEPSAKLARTRTLELLEQHLG